MEPRKIRPYQQTGVDWLWEGKRKLLTDSYGLGKTSEAVWAAERPALIAAPGTLLDHWRREIKACLPDAVVRVADAKSVYARKVQLLAGNGYYPGGVDLPDFYVCNTELLRTGMHDWLTPLRVPPRKAGGEYPDCQIKTFIVDEAHRLRGRSALQTQGAREVAKRVERVYLLTASPVYNQPNDLWSLLNILDPDRFGSYWRFCDQYLVMDQTPWGPRILGLKKDKLLLKHFREYALGRTRAQVHAQLPALQQQTVEVTPPDTWYREYRRAKSEYRVRYDGSVTSGRSILEDLRSRTQSPKMHAVCQLLVDHGCTERTIVFTYHKALAYTVGKMLDWPVITGDMAPYKREQAARASDSVVATIPAVAEGLNFAHIEHVIFMEHDWQPGMLEQALNRVYRPGNTHEAVSVYHIVVKNSADTRLYNIASKRGVTLEEVVQAVLAEVDEEGEEVGV